MQKVLKLFVISVFKIYFSLLLARLGMSRIAASMEGMLNIQKKTPIETGSEEEKYADGQFPVQNRESLGVLGSLHQEQLMTNVPRLLNLSAGKPKIPDYFSTYPQFP